MKRIKVFTDRYPYLGPAIWILTVEYFIIQLIVATSWKVTAYSWRFNTISDLGSTTCGYLDGRYVCSPLHSLMNISLIALGFLMSSGSLLIYQEFRERTSTFLGFSLMGMAGFGTLVVGIFPENTVSLLHILGASLPFLLGNISLIILGLSLFSRSKILQTYTVLSGVISLIALAFYVTHHYTLLGIGGMERIISYPQTVWLIFFGLYMSHNEYFRPRKISK